MSDRKPTPPDAATEPEGSLTSPPYYAFGVRKVGKEYQAVKILISGDRAVVTVERPTIPYRAIAFEQASIIMGDEYFAGGKHGLD